MLDGRWAACSGQHGKNKQFDRMAGWQKNTHGNMLLW